MDKPAQRGNRMGRIFDQILVVLFWLAGALLMFSTVGTCVDVLLRYCLNRPIPWMLEITEYVMLYIPFLGAALVLKEDGHIRVDIILNHLSQQARKRLHVFTSFVGGLVMLTYTYWGGQVTLDHWKRGVPALESLKTPMFLILMIIPIGSLFFAVQFFRQMVGGDQKPKV